MKRSVLMIFSAVVVIALILQSSPAFSDDSANLRFQKFFESLKDYRGTFEARPLGNEEDLNNIASSGAKVILRANDIFYLTGEHKQELESFKALVSKAHEKGIFIEGVIEAFAFRGEDAGDEKAIDEMCFHRKDGSRIFFQTEGGKIYVGNLYSPKYKQFLLEQAKKLIDSDVDAIFVSNVLTAMGTDIGPPGVGSSKEAGEVTRENLNPAPWKELADSIRQYSLGKGKYVGTSTFWWDGEPAPFVDYQTLFYQVDADWKKLKDDSKKILDRDVPFIVTMDSGSAMLFLNKLNGWNETKKEDFFKMALADCRDNNITFAFPYRVMPFVDSVKDNYLGIYRKVISSGNLPQGEALAALHKNFEGELSMGPPGEPSPGGRPQPGQGGPSPGNKPSIGGPVSFLDILINMKPALTQAQWLKIAKIARDFFSKRESDLEKFLSGVRMVLTEAQRKIFDSRIRKK